MKPTLTQVAENRFLLNVEGRTFAVESDPATIRDLLAGARNDGLVVNCPAPPQMALNMEPLLPTPHVDYGEWAAAGPKAPTGNALPGTYNPGEWSDGWAMAANAAGVAELSAEQWRRYQEETERLRQAMVQRDAQEAEAAARERANLDRVLAANADLGSPLIPPQLDYQTGEIFR